MMKLPATAVFRGRYFLDHSSFDRQKKAGHIIITGLLLSCPKNRKQAESPACLSAC